MRHSKTGEPIAVRNSPVHGRGVFARRALAPCSFIGHYAGRRHGEAAAREREWNDRVTYLFGLSDGTLIDGADGGNATRYLNHCCEPNCEAVESEGAGGQLEIALYTIRPVLAGDELFLDYALTIDEGTNPADFPCACGAARCRGTLVSSSGGQPGSTVGASG
jgi:hypothetical protein